MPSKMVIIPVHPARLWWRLTFLFVALVVLFGFISIFVPWAVKDISVGVRAWAFPFKTCLENTFSTVNEETCLDNDFIVGELGVPLTGGNNECKCYILSTIAFVIISLLLSVILLVVMAYILENLWSSPLVIAYIVIPAIIVDCFACYLAWITFAVYMEMTCAPNSIFPISTGYSYGWILYLFNSVWSMAAVATAIVGTIQMKRYREEEAEENFHQMSVVVSQSPRMQPMVPVSSMVYARTPSPVPTLSSPYRVR